MACMSGIPEHEMSKRRAKSEIKRYWLEMGRWSEFIELRESLKGAGMAAELAWGEADTRMRSGESAPVASSDQAPAAPAAPVEPVELRGQAAATVFSKESVSTAETVRWVASYLMVGDAQPEDAPSSEAWGMLQWAKRNNTNEASFWSQIWRQLMPTKQSLEAETRFSDDGKPILDLIQRIQRISESGNESDNG